MAGTTASSLQIAAARPYFSHRVVKAGAPAIFGANSKTVSWTKLTSACNYVSSLEPFRRGFTSSPINLNNKIVTTAINQSSENVPSSGLPIDLKGLICFL